MLGFAEPLNNNGCFSWLYGARVKTVKCWKPAGNDPGDEAEDDDEEEIEGNGATADAILRDCRYNLHVTMMASNRFLKARVVFFQWSFLCTRFTVLVLCFRWYVLDNCWRSSQSPWSSTQTRYMETVKGIMLHFWWCRRTRAMSTWRVSCSSLEWLVASACCQGLLFVFNVVCCFLFC